MKQASDLIASMLSSFKTAGPEDSNRLEAANEAFAFNLLKQVAHDQPAQNIFISPYSASTVLQMVGTGAAGQTRTEMEQVLGTQGMSAKSLGEANRAIANSLNHLNPGVVLNTANAIWYRCGEAVNLDFLDLNRWYFDSTVEPIDFADPGCVDIINAWAGEKTNGRIPRIVDGMIDPVYSRLFLASAVYFKGKWSEPFKPENTRDRTFYLRDGRQKRIPMMRQSKTFIFYRGTGCQAVRLPYRAENLAMYVFLPDTNSSLEQLLGVMDGDHWRRVAKPGFSKKKGLLVLPKFKLEFQAKLVPALKSLGIKMAFDAEKADFSGIGSQFYISDVIQKTFVEVKEEGTEAAAASFTEIQVLCIPERPPDRFEMIVERPFMFLVEDNQTGTILFIGLIFEPQTMG